MKLKNLKKDTIVRIENENEYLLLMDLAEKAGYLWISGVDPKTYNDIEKYKKCAGVMLCKCKSIYYYPHFEGDEKTVPLKKVIKFEVGDVVRVRKDLSELDSEESPCIIDSMLSFAGKKVEIKSCSNEFRKKRYQFVGDDFDWLKKWFEPVFDEEEQKEYYNGKIIFTKGDEVFKTGHIYEVKDGKIKSPESGIKHPIRRKPFETLSDIEDYFNKDSVVPNKWSVVTLEFIEVKND